jgi:hypothetical protein
MMARGITSRVTTYWESFTLMRMISRGTMISLMWKAPELRYIVLGVFKVNKHRNVTFLIIWNILTQKSTIFVAEIFPNDHFLSLNQNPTTLSLSQ